MWREKKAKEWEMAGSIPRRLRSREEESLLELTHSEVAVPARLTHSWVPAPAQLTHSWVPAFPRLTHSEVAAPDRLTQREVVAPDRLTLQLNAGLLSFEGFR